MRRVSSFSAEVLMHSCTAKPGCRGELRPDNQTHTNTIRFPHAHTHTHTGRLVLPLLCATWRHHHLPDRAAGSQLHYGRDKTAFTWGEQHHGAEQVRQRLDVPQPRK